MELNTNELLLDLVRGQEHTQTMVKDMSDRLFGTGGQPGILMTMHKEHKDEFQKLDGDREKLQNRVEGVEKKVWYATGFGAALGAIASFVGFKIHH